MDTLSGPHPDDSDAPGPGGHPQARTPRADRWLPWMACVLALSPYSALLWPDGHLVFGGYDGPGGCDYAAYQLPVHRFVRSELLRGRFPLWMPSLGCGTPLHAAQQAAVTYPLLTPFLLLFPANYGLRFALFFHAALGYCGQFLLARRLRLTRPASAFAALVFTLAGYPVSHLLAGHVGLLFAYGLLPWFFLALVRLLARPGARTAADLALVLSLLLLTGHPQLPYYAFLFGALWALGSLAKGEGARHRLRVITWAASGGVVVVLLVAVQWLPWLELFRDGRPFAERGGTYYASIGALRPEEWMLLIFPNARGNPYAGIPSYLLQLTMYHEKACYVGLVTLGLIGAALARENRYRWQMPMLALCGLAIMIAMGRKLPLLGLASTFVPGLTQFRCPGRVGALLGFFASLLAASGLEAVLNREPLTGGRRVRPALLLGGPPVLCVAALAFSHLARSSYFDYVRASLLGPLGLAGLLAASNLAAAALALVHARRSPSTGAALLTVVVFLDLYTSQAMHVRLEEPNAALGGTIPAPPSPGRFTVTDPDGESLRHSPLVSLLGEGPLSGVVTNEGGIVPASLERLHAGLLDPVTRDKVMRLSACDLLYDPERRTWIRLTDGLGRVRLAGELDLQELHAEGRFLDLSPGMGSVEVLRETPQHIVSRARADRPSLLIVADCDYPGWGARVDGRAVPVERVHGSFRAVVVPTGDHRVEMAYAPSSFRRGVAGTIAGLLLLALLYLQGPPPEGN